MSEEERIAAAEAEVSRLSLNNNNRNKIHVSFDRFGVKSSSFQRLSKNNYRFSKNLLTPFVNIGGGGEGFNE